MEKGRDEAKWLIQFVFYLEKIECLYGVAKYNHYYRSSYFADGWVPAKILNK